MVRVKCPVCGAEGFEFCAGHKVKVKGGWDAENVYDVCMKCGYESEKYVPIAAGKPFVVKLPPRSGKTEERLVKKTITEDKRITFTAKAGDAEINIKVGPEGLRKLLSMLMEG